MTRILCRIEICSATRSATVVTPEGELVAECFTCGDPGYLHPVDGSTETCQHCNKPIIYRETPIDDFWTHVHTAIGYCNPTENWPTAKWAEPKGEVNVTS